MVSRHIGKVHVPTDIAAEVKQLSQNDYDDLGILVVTPSTAQYLEAGGRIARLSFQDRLCFIIARDEGWTCVSNDGPLRELCEEHGVATLWALQPMLELVHRGHLTPAAAINTAEAIHKGNPRYITRMIVDTFTAKAQTPAPRAKAAAVGARRAPSRKRH